MILDAGTLKGRFEQRMAGVRDNKVYIGPEIVTFEPTNACNLNCQFCIAGHAPGNPAHFDRACFFAWEEFLAIVADAVALEVDQITIAGPGEPTLHPQFREMMNHLQAQPLKAVLVTNATFPVDYCEDVIKADHVIINLSAVNRQQYRDIQGKDLFERVVANIRRLVTLRDAGKPGFLIDIAYIVNVANSAQQRQMRKLALKLGVNTVDFKTMNVNAYNRGIVIPGSTQERMPASCLNGWFYHVVMLGGNFSCCYKISQMPSAVFGKWSFKQFWLSKHLMKTRLLGKYGHFQRMFKACRTCPFYEENEGLAQNQRFWKPGGVF